MLRMETNRFDDAALTWDEKPGRIAIAHGIAETIRAQIALGREMRVLDYGCGTGLVGLYLQPYVGHVTGMDSSTGMIEAMKAKIERAALSNVRAVVADMRHEALSEERYDVITASMVLHHVLDTAGLLRRFAGALAPGGQIALADLDREDGTFHQHGNTDVAHFGFDRDGLEEMLVAAGFDAVRFETAHVVRRPPREYPIFLVTARKR